jgi:hypothetical protein
MGFVETGQMRVLHCGRSSLSRNADLRLRQSAAIEWETFLKEGNWNVAGKRIQLLLAATLAVMSSSVSHAYLSQSDRPEQVIQIGALESEAEAQQRLRAARQFAQPLLNNAREFIEPVDKGSKRLYRARFAVDSDMVQAVCVMLKKANVSCIAISPTPPTDAAPVVVTPASARPERPPSVSPQARTTSPPPHRAEPAQPKSIWQGIKDTTFLGDKPK